MSASTKARKLFSKNPLIYRKASLLHRQIRSRTYGYFNWSQVINENFKNLAHDLKQNQNDAKQILVATSAGSHLASTTLESALVAALTLRGCKVRVLLCDELLPTCMECETRWYPTTSLQKNLANNGPKKICQTCYKPAKSFYEQLGVSIHGYSEFLSSEDANRIEKIVSEIAINDIKDFSFDGCAIGDHAYAGALRFYARGDLDNEPTAKLLLKSYFRSALISYFVSKKFFLTFKITAAVFNHGIYVPQGLIGEAARKANVRVINWNPAYRKKCFIFSENDTYHHTLMNENIEIWKKMPWDKKKENDIVSYLNSRRYGTNDWISFHNPPIFEKQHILKSLKFDAKKPIITLLTNVVWDAQLHYPANAFTNMIEWIIETVHYFEKRSDLQLAIRVHPAEVNGAIPSRQTVEQEIRKKFRSLPENITLISPQSNTSSYTLCELSDSVLIYGTKMGVELTSMGIPVIVAGEAWIRGKGLTSDISNKTDYLNTLNSLPIKHRLPEDTIALARKYAYHFFMRRMIPFTFTKPINRWPHFTLDIASVYELDEGKDKGLDLVCKGIIQGTPFVFDN